jgi:general secretion pathway protein M
MIDEVKARWEAFTGREKLLIVVMLALLALVVLWAGVWRPVQSGLVAARERQAAAVTGLAATRAKVAALSALDAQKAAPIADAGPVVGAMATEAGFTLSRNDRIDPGTVAIAMPQAAAPALFAWFEALRARGIYVDRAAIRATGNGTVAVDATLKARSQ